MMKTILYPIAVAVLLLAPMQLSAAEETSEASKVDKSEKTQPVSGQDNTTKES